MRIKVIISAVLVPIDAKHTWSYAPRSKSPKFVKMRVIFPFLRKNVETEDTRILDSSTRLKEGLNSKSYFKKMPFKPEKKETESLS